MFTKTGLLAGAIALTVTAVTLSASSPADARGMGSRTGMALPPSAAFATSHSTAAIATAKAEAAVRANLNRCGMATCFLQPAPGHPGIGGRFGGEGYYRFGRYEPRSFRYRHGWHRYAWFRNHHFRHRHWYPLYGQGQDFSQS